MSYKNQVLIWGSSLLFSTALMTTVYNATNPEYNFPGITEILLIGISLLLVANSLFSGKSLTRKEWALGGILLVMIGILALRYLLGWNDPSTIESRRCFWMPGYFAKLECLLQLPFMAHHGLRQLLFHFTALSVFLGVASLSRMSGSLRPWLLIPLAVPALIISLGVLAPVYYNKDFSLTGFNFIYGNFSHIRGRGVIANPSWLWPWLAPAMGIGLASIFAKNWALKAIGLVLFILCAWASLSVMQRGGYLIVGILIAALFLVILYCIGNIWSKLIAWTMVSSGFFGLGYLAYDSSRITMIFSWLQHLGLTIRGSPLQRSHERLKMWSVAWEESIQDNLWLGNGYGTWLREFSHLPNSGGVSFDTAHNLWIQLIFELGVIHVVVMAIILGLIVWSTLVYKNVEQISLKIGGLFLIIGFFVASVVQEIDYIMPVYIQFAVFAGLCFGGRSFEETDAKGKVTHNQRAWSLIGISFLLVIGAFYYASSISWGGSTFEATQMAFNRWFRPIGAIVATPDRRGREYSLYWSEHGQFNKESFTTLGTTFPEMWIQGNALYLKNGTKWKPRQYQYESQKNIYHSQRLVSFGLHQPHGQTNIILLAENGMYSWEFAGFGEDGTQVGKWCKQSCRLLLYSPNGKDQPHGVRLQMPHAELDENRPAHLVVTMLSIRGEISSFLSDEATQKILNAPFPEGSANKEFVFRNSGDVHHLPVDFRQHQLWLISLKANQVFIPKEHLTNSTDSRKLGTRVLF